MKHILFAVLALVLAIPASIAMPHVSSSEVVADAQAYQAGFRAGWAAGWKKVKGTHSIPPVPPIPPIPAAGRQNYESGFADGVIAGMNRANQ